VPEQPAAADVGLHRAAQAGAVRRGRRVYLEQATALSGGEEDRKYLLYQFLTRMAGAGRPQEAYAEVDAAGAEYAFAQLGRMVEEGCDRGDAEAVANLPTLVARHTKRAGTTAWTVFYQGVADEGQKKYEHAQRLYAETMRRLMAGGYTPAHRDRPAAADKGWDRVRHRRAYCLWRLGRWEQVYDQCEPAKDTFHWLSQMFAGPEHAEDLQRLVDRHRARFLAYTTLPYCQPVVYWHHKDYARAVPLFEEHLRVGQLPYYFELQARDRKFRGLVRLGRLDEARDMLHPPKKKALAGRAALRDDPGGFDRGRGHP
jgi:hypothetical protein